MTLPTFIIIGVAKAGATSLYRYLDRFWNSFCNKNLHRKI